ncbi:hypothetical protein, partial [Piscirickettsia litoralis]
PEQFTQMQELGLNKAYIKKALDKPEQFTQMQELGLNKAYIKKALDKPEQFAQMQALGLNKAYTQKAFDNPEQFAQMQGLGLNKTYTQKAFDNPEQFANNYQKLLKLHTVYNSIVSKVKKNEFDVHGFGGGNTITLDGEQKTVPRGISKIWSEITDEHGNFKLMDDVDSALKNSKSQANNRKSSRGATVVSIFFGSYRDPKLKKAYNEISQSFD